MKPLRQSLDEILGSLTEMEAGWEDRTSQDVAAALLRLPAKPEYSVEDVQALLEREPFAIAMTVARLFLDQSRDRFDTVLPAALGPGGAGVKRMQRDPRGFAETLTEMGLAAAMTRVVNTPVGWPDLLGERLKGGRGRAIRGQNRGRSLEDFVEAIVRRVFGAGGYELRCKFVGSDGRRTAKADVAVPSRADPRIVIEAKGYAATGSKQTDVLGDLQAIIAAKRHDTTLLFVTDGLTWRRRTNDLRKAVEMQNRGEVARIYTRSMAEEMESDLRTLKGEHGL